MSQRRPIRVEYREDTDEWFVIYNLPKTRSKVPNKDYVAAFHQGLYQEWLAAGGKGTRGKPASPLPATREEPDVALAVERSLQDLKLQQKRQKRQEEEAAAAAEQEEARRRERAGAEAVQRRRQPPQRQPRERAALIGIPNVGNTCWLNVGVQCVRNTPGIWEAVKEAVRRSTGRDLQAAPLLELLHALEVGDSTRMEVLAMQLARTVALMDNESKSGYGTALEAAERKAKRGEQVRWPTNDALHGLFYLLSILFNTGTEKIPGLGYPVTQLFPQWANGVDSQSVVSRVFASYAVIGDVEVWCPNAVRNREQVLAQQNLDPKNRVKWDQVRPALESFDAYNKLFQGVTCHWSHNVAAAEGAILQIEPLLWNRFRMSPLQAIHHQLSLKREAGVRGRILDNYANEHTDKHSRWMTTDWPTGLVCPECCSQCASILKNPDVWQGLTPDERGEVVKEFREALAGEHGNPDLAAMRMLRRWYRDSMPVFRNVRRWPPALILTGQDRDSNYRAEIEPEFQVPGEDGPIVYRLQTAAYNLGEAHFVIHVRSPDGVWYLLNDEHRPEPGRPPGATEASHTLVFATYSR